MKKINNESGFGAIEILLVILIVVIIAFGGYYAYSRNKSSTSPGTTSSTPITTTNAKSNDSTSKSTPRVVLGQGDYSFTAPAGWKYATSHSGLGDVYEDADGNQIIITEGLGYDNNVQADYAWEANADASSGIKIIAKSQACNNAGTQTSFKGFTYTCDSDSSKTVVIVFVAAQGGEIHAGNHIYRLAYVGKDTLLDQYETILGTFSFK